MKQFYFNIAAFLWPTTANETIIEKIDFFYKLLSLSVGWITRKVKAKIYGCQAGKFYV